MDNAIQSRSDQGPGWLAEDFLGNITSHLSLICTGVEPHPHHVHCQPSINFKVTWIPDGKMSEKRVVPGEKIEYEHKARGTHTIFTYIRLEDIGGSLRSRTAPPYAQRTDTVYTHSMRKEQS